MPSTTNERAGAAVASQTMIEARGIHKTFGQVPVLRNVSLTVGQGEVVALIGPSGSGKSTFLRCLNGLEEVSDGDIFIEGVKLNDPKVNLNALRAELGMVFQRFNLFPHRTALENVVVDRLGPHVLLAGDVRF